MKLAYFMCDKNFSTVLASAQKELSTYVILAISWHPCCCERRKRITLMDADKYYSALSFFASQYNEPGMLTMKMCLFWFYLERQLLPYVPRRG